MSLSHGTVACGAYREKENSRQREALPGVDATAIHGWLGAPVALLQSRTLPTATEAYIKVFAFEKSPVDKPHT